MSLLCLSVNENMEEEGGGTARRAGRCQAVASKDGVCGRLRASFVHPSNRWVIASLERSYGMPFTNRCAAASFHILCLHACFVHVSEATSTSSRLLLELNQEVSSTVGFSGRSTEVFT